MSGDTLFHICNVNRGIELKAFHNIVFFTPATTAGDTDLHNEVFSEVVNIIVK
jgi:hypothetical protein